MRKLINDFRKDTSGVALVEFAIFLPVFVLSLAVVVEGARIFFSYQAAVVGVRDAARYLSRTAPGDICTIWANSGIVENYDASIQTALVGIIDEAMDNENDQLPSQVTRGTVAATWVCEAPPSAGTVTPGGVVTEYRQALVPMAQVSAQFTITYPLGNVFNLNGFTLPTIDHIVVDRSRIFGV